MAEVVPMDLLERYDVPGPRYTSYPTAAQFSPSLKPDVVDAALAASPRDRPLSLYFHVPFCRHLCWYCACNKIITRHQERSETYVDSMVAELDRTLVLATGRSVSQVHFGGGTPTFLRPGEFHAIFDALAARTSLTEDAEIAVEIDPRELSDAHLGAFADIGLNRASLGVQDFDHDVQVAIHRVQSAELVSGKVEDLRGIGVDSISFDLVYGLPKQTTSTFAATLESVVEMRPDRLAIYSYAHLPSRNPAQRLLERHHMPDGKEKLALLQLIIEQLTAAGYVQIGMDHFALPTDGLALAEQTGELRRNFQGYSTHAQTDVIGIGVTAISTTDDVIYQNEKEIDVYMDRVSSGRSPVERGHYLTEDDRIRRDAIAQIMCNGLLDLDEISQRYGIDAVDYFSAETANLASLEDDGMLRRTPSGLQVSPLGRMFVRNIAMVFDAYLSSDNATRFSRTV